MDKSDRTDQPRVITEEFIEKVDKLTKSPSERASDVWVKLAKENPKLTNWDLVCFCVETLGLISAEFPWLRQGAMMVSQIVYKAHYLNHDRIAESDHEIDVNSMNVPRMTEE